MKKIIMVVEDNPDVLYTIKSNLESINKNYEVIGAESGSECLEMLKKIKPDLIFLDIMMAGVDGWDVCATIKGSAQIKNIPVVFLTAKTDPFSVDFGKAGADGYITKPYEISDLKKMTAKFLDKLK